MTKARKRRGVTPSPLFSWLSGIIADVVFVSRRYGRTLSLRRTKTLKVHWKRIDAPPGVQTTPCPCENFRRTDLRWRSLTEEQKNVWRAAVKNPHMTGFQLYMNENCHTLYTYGEWANVPGPGGGFSCTNAIPEEVPENSWIGLPPVTTYHCTGPPSWACIPALLGEFPSWSACLATCPPWGWTCSGEPYWTCDYSAHGVYESLEACEVNCPPPLWDCSGWPDYICARAEGGEFNTLEECQDNCPPWAWGCTGAPDWICLYVQGGEFLTLEDCTLVCAPQIPGFYCVQRWEYPGNRMNPNWDCSGWPQIPAFHECFFLPQEWFDEYGWGACIPGFIDPFNSSKLFYVGGPFGGIMECVGLCP